MHSPNSVALAYGSLSILLANSSPPPLTTRMLASLPGRKQYPSCVVTDGQHPHEDARQQRHSRSPPRWFMKLNRKWSTCSDTTLTDEPVTSPKNSSLQHSSYAAADIKTDLVRCSSPEEYFATKADQPKSKGATKKLLASNSSGVTSALAISLVIGEATNLPYLKGIAGIAALIIKTSEVRSLLSHYRPNC